MKAEYKFSLYGVSESGKTCFLATISMGATGHAGDLSAVRLPVTVPKPTGVKNLSKADKEALALHHGKEWMDTAVQNLESGGLPPPTPPDTVERVIVLKIGSPVRGEFNLKMIDYSGELINPEMENQPGGASAKLKKELQTSDGFLILVEAPAARNDSHALQKIYDAIRPLREAFASLNNKKDMVQIPVAIAFTKWDQFTKIDFDNPGQEKNKIPKFLESYEPFDSLVTAIANSMVNQLPSHDATDCPGFLKLNCRVFPVSSFGISEKRELDGKNRELPTKDLNRCFGILDPLVWLANRKDELDADRIEKTWLEKGKSWWLPLNLKNTNKEIGFCKEFLERSPKQTEQHKKITGFRNTYQASWFIGIFIYLTFAIFIVDAGWSKWNTSQFDKNVRLAENHDTKEPELENARKWFAEYNTVWRGIFGPKRASAQKQASEIESLLDERSWSPVFNSEGAAKADAASAYIVKRPNGPHHEEAVQIIKTHEREAGEKINRDWLITVKQQIGSASTISELETVLNNARRGFPSTHLPKEMDDELQTLIAKATQDLDERKKNKDYETFVIKYKEMYKNKKFQDTALLLLGSKQFGARWEKHIQSFPEEVLEIYRPDLQQHLNDNDYSKARKIALEAKEAFKILEDSLRGEWNALAAMQKKGIQSINAEEDKINLFEDQFWYKFVTDRKNTESCDNYLKSAPLQTMKSNVSDYKTYKDKISKKLNLTISVKIKWDEKDVKASDNKISLDCEDVSQFSTKWDTPSTPGVFSNQIGTFKLEQKKLDDSIKIKVNIQRSWYYFGTDKVGEGEATIKISDLTESGGYRLRLPKDNIGNIAIFEVTDGLPQEPELPLWKK